MLSFMVEQHKCCWSVDWNVVEDCLKEYIGEYAEITENSSSIIREMIEIATNKTFAENYAQKHNTDAKFGWYRFDARFEIPVYDDAGELVRYNVFKARILVRHAKDGKLYLYIDTALGQSQSHKCL